MKLYSTYAVVIAMVVTNIILWNGVIKYVVPHNETLIQSNVAHIGDEYNGTNFLYNESVFSNSTNSYVNEVTSR